MKKTFYNLPEKDRERLKKSEAQSAMWCLNALSSAVEGQMILKNRLECIPNGKVRWRLMVGQLQALMNDIFGTVPEKQRRHIKNLMHDMELRLTPKGTPYTSNRVILDTEDLSFLVLHAKNELCTACALMDDEARDCELYKIMYTYASLEDYGNGLICPYCKDDWTEKMTAGEASSDSHKAKQPK